MWTQDFSSRMVHTHAQHIMHDVSGIRVLSNQFSECFKCAWFWPLCSPDMVPYEYFLWGYVKDSVHCTNQHTVQDLQVKTEAVANIIGDMLHDTIDNFVIHYIASMTLKDLILDMCSHEDHMYTNSP
jgi:hypothetical protein